MKDKNEKSATSELSPVPDGILPKGKDGVPVMGTVGPFAHLLDTDKFDHMWRVAQMFARSRMVPAHFQNAPEDCFVACQMAIRLDVDPMMFMQSTYVVKGRPAMEAKLAIALTNARGPFTGPIQYVLEGEGDGRKCTAYAVHKTTGERCEMQVDVATAKKEGWWDQNPKWRNLTDLMLRYRAAAWLARLYAPETIMGMITVDEAEDVAAVTTRPVARPMIDVTPAESGSKAERLASEQKKRRARAKAKAADSATAKADTTGKTVSPKQDEPSFDELVRRISAAKMDMHPTFSRTQLDQFSLGNWGEDALRELTDAKIRELWSLIDEHMASRCGNKASLDS